MASHQSTVASALVLLFLQFFPVETACQAAETSLTPSGAPTPTLRTLDQIEPRTPISGSCIITNSGSYYLTGNIATTSSGIIIRTNNVTIDLMGYTLSGDRDSSDYGIWVSGLTNAVRRGVCIRNGSGTDFSYGVMLENARNCRIEGIASTTNRNFGIYLNAQTNGIIKDNVILRCSATENGSGIRLYGGNGGVCEGNQIQDCVFERNANYGISMNGIRGKCAYNSVRSTTIRNNVWGIYLIDENGVCFGNRVRNCSILDNTYNGITIQGTSTSSSSNWIQNNQTHGNKQYGIQITDGIENLVTGNNACSSSFPGFKVCAHNLIFQNFSAAATPNFFLDALAVYGPIVSANSALSTNGASAHPWANFSQ